MQLRCFFCTVRWHSVSLRAHLHVPQVNKRLVVVFTHAVVSAVWCDCCISLNGQENNPAHLLYSNPDRAVSSKMNNDANPFARHVAGVHSFAKVSFVFATSILIAVDNCIDVSPGCSGKPIEGFRIDSSRHRGATMYILMTLPLCTSSFRSNDGGTN